MAASTRAIEELYRSRYSAFRGGVATLTGSYDSARDVVQETFAQALRDRRQYRGDGSLESWVWRIAFRTALRTRGGPTVEELAEASSPPSPEQDPELADAIRNLPPRRRLVLFLRYFADLSYSEIASLLEISEGTVAATLAHAHGRPANQAFGEGGSAMSTETIEQRLNEFVADTDEPDWNDVRARAGTRDARFPRRRLVLALAVCMAIAALAAFLSGAFSSTAGSIGGLPDPYFNPLELQFRHDGSRLTSIDVTVNAATVGGTVLIRVMQGVDVEPHTGHVVFQESAPMTDVTSPVSGPPGLELLSTWSGTLSPSDWTGGCQQGPYEITVQVTPAFNPTNPDGPPPNGESIESGSFSCSAWVPFT